MGNPDRHGGVKQQKQIPHTHVYARTSETRIENAEGDAGCGKSTTGSNISSTTKCQVAQDGVGIDLGGEDFEHGRQ